MSTVNTHGVCTTNETVRVPIPKSVRAEARIYLAQLADGWRYGWSLGTAESYSGCGPWKSQPPYHSRDDALSAGLDRAVEFFLDQIKRRSSKAEIARAKSALKSITEYRGKHPHLQTEEPMNAVATEKPKRKAKTTNGNGKHRTPDETGTTTPAGIAANDPAAVAAAWDALKPRLSELCGLPAIDNMDHLQVSLWLDPHYEPPAKELAEDLAEAKALLAKYSDLLSTPPGADFPGESPPTKVDRMKRDAEIFGAASKALKKQRQADVINAAANDVLAGMGLPATVGTPPKKETRDFGGKTLSRISIAHCVRHPDNREPAPADVEALAESIEREGMLEPPVVRPHRGQYQIISGETRILALRKLGRKGEIDAHVLTGCDDARALELLAIYNAKRKDLNAIEKAKMIDRLCHPTAEGGAGLTREAAAKVYDLESGAAASNLVRLLDLPKVWQDRVASGELPWTFARELLPIAKAPLLFAHVDDHWNQKWYRENQFTRREGVKEMVAKIIECYTRPIDGKTKHRYPYDAVGEWNIERPRLFELTDDLRKKLQIVTIGNVDLATNAKLYDEHNVPIIKERLAQSRKDQARRAAATRDARGGGRQAEEKKAAQLANRITLWRHRWLVHLLLPKVSVLPQLREWLVAWLLDSYVSRSLYIEGPEFPQLAKMAMREDGQVALNDLYKVGTTFVCQVLAKDAEAEYPQVQEEELDALCKLARIDLASEWAALQVHSGSKEDRARMETFFELHQTAQLDSLGNELGVHVEHVSGKAAKIKLLTTCSRTLKLPKSIKPVAGVAKGKPKAKRGEPS